MYTIVKPGEVDGVGWTAAGGGGEAGVGTAGGDGSGRAGGVGVVGEGEAEKAGETNVSQPRNFIRFKFLLTLAMQCRKMAKL